MTDQASPAVVLFIYNRPDVTARVFDAIRRAQPRRLFVFADGAPTEQRADVARTDAAREATGNVDWSCDVHRDYAAAHLGIKRRVESGLDRVFDEVECAVVLEDDCLPDPSFFSFASDLLERFRDDPRVMSVCGSRLTPVRPSSTHSYAFSRYPFLWGWATWRRAWRCYDGGMQAWTRLREEDWLSQLLDDRHAAAYWRYVFDATWQAGDSGDWDTAWLCSSWIHGGLAVVPAMNLVTNLGFQRDATHTRDPRHRFAAMASHAMPCPLFHPDTVAPSTAEERLAADHVFSGNLERLMGELRRRVRVAQ